MLEFFDTIAGYAEAFWEYTTHGIDATVDAIGYLLSAFQLGNVLAPFLPAVIGASVTAVIAIATIRMVTSIL